MEWVGKNRVRDCRGKPTALRGLGTESPTGKGTAKILKNNIYTVYIIYILYICTKDGTMEATVTYKKKIIDLKEDTFKALSVMAARQGTNLKKLIENLLDKTAEEYDDSEAYRYMTENYPDGKVKLEKNERKEFMDWLGVVEK